MHSENDISWFGGILDAEGCFGLRRHASRATQVLAHVQCGLVDKPEVEYAKAIAEQMYGKKLTLHRRKITEDSGNHWGKRDYWSFTMVAKKNVFQFVQQTLPYLRVKRNEALLQHAFLERAAARRHIGNEFDFALCALSERMKHVGGVRPEEISDFAKDVFPWSGNRLAWLAGYTDGDGCISVCEGMTYVTYSCVNREELVRANELIANVTGLPPVHVVVAPPTKPGGRVSYRAQIQDRARIERLLPAIQPFMRVKARQAELVLEMMGMPRSARSSHEREVKFLNQRSGLDEVPLISETIH